MLEEFTKYVNNYDMNDENIRLKYNHSIRVMELSRKYAQILGFNDEDIYLATLIGLLHDIGRFEQLKDFGSFEDYKTMDHAIFGAKILFEEGLIRKFVEEDSYDDIIREAILNHNKLEIEKDRMDELTLFHSKLIRDSDKIDNFRLQSEIEPDKIFNTDLERIEHEALTSPTYDSLMKKQVVIYKERKTNVDKWVSLLGFLYDFNFEQSLEYIKDKDYINRSMSRIDYKDKDTIKRVQEVTEIANQFIDKELNKIDRSH